MSAETLTITTAGQERTFELPAMVIDMPHEVYHADSWGPSFSRSIAAELLRRSPLHAWYVHPRLGGAPSELASASQDRGGLLHSLLFGVDHAEQIEPLEVDDFKTKAAREARDEAIAAGRIPVKASTYRAAVDAAQRLRDRIRELGVDLDRCRREVTILWRSDAVLCKARLDLVDLERGLIFDSKFCEDASPDRFKRVSVGYGYDIQHAVYIEALEACLPALEGRVKMEFLLCEPNPPHAAVRVVPNATMRGLGRSRWLKAKATWAACLESGEWPAWGSRPVGVDAPGWALQDDMMAGYEEPEWARGV